MSLKPTAELMQRQARRLARIEKSLTGIVRALRENAQDVEDHDRLAQLRLERLCDVSGLLLRFRDSAAEATANRILHLLRAPSTRLHERLSPGESLASVGQRDLELIAKAMLDLGERVDVQGWTTDPEWYKNKLKRKNT